MTRDQVPHSHPLFGNLMDFANDPLEFLAACAGSGDSLLQLRMITRHVVLLLDPDLVQQVLIAEQKNFRKPSWLGTKPVRRLLGDGLVTSEGEQWTKQRKQCHPAFSNCRMAAYAEDISTSAARMLDRWSSIETIDIQKEITALTLEIVGRLLFGEDRTEWIKEASSAMDILMERFARKSSLFGFMPLPSDGSEREAARQLNRAVKSLVSRHRDSKKHRYSNELGESDVPRLMELIDRCPVQTAECESSKPRLSAAMETELEEQVKTFLTAGHESSALTVTWALLLLNQNKSVLIEAEAEVDRVLQGRSPNLESVALLNFLGAVVQETLRLYPPLWMIGREPLTDCVIGALKIKKGTMILISPWALHRNPNYFEDPDEFRPERWLSANKLSGKLPRCAYVPFGAGARVCIGQSFATNEILIILASILQRYNLEIANQDMHPIVSMTLRPPLGIVAKWTARQVGS